jgi:hypothetical protein
MRLINTTRVHSYDPDETEILLLKLYLEDSLMERWYFMENEYTFSGEHKGFYLRKLIQTDPRFAPYRSKITVIEKSFDSHANEAQDRQTRMGLTWRSEAYLKDAVVPVILYDYPDDTWVTVADADEMLDLFDPIRRELVMQQLEGPRVPLFLPMIRYWYDFDNYARGRGYTILPMNLIREKKSIKSAYDDYQHEAAPNPECPLAFEYCACCSKERILHKIQTVPFYYHTMGDFEVAFECNYWPKARSIGEVPLDPTAHPDNWFEQVELTPKNSPLVVREALAEIKTHNIDPNYRENRKRMFPQWFK